jgi:glycerate dehydrogenase
MNIVVLDGFTCNPGDLSWEPLTRLGECKLYDRTQPDQTVQRSINADIILTNKTVLKADIITQLPQLKYVGVLATGYNIVDLELTRKRGIPVTNVPDYSTVAVVQMVFAHLLNLTNRVAEHANSVSKGDWSNAVEFFLWYFTLL